MYFNEKSDTPDNCYSWAIALACNIMYFLAFGMFRITGVLFSEIVRSYNIDRQLASLPFVIQPSVRNITGIGNALATAALPHLIYLYFKKHVSTATGFALTGAPIAGFVLSPVTAVLLEKYGLSGTFLMLAGIVLHAVPVAMFLEEPKSNSSLSDLCCVSRKNKKQEKFTRGVKHSTSNYTVNQTKSEGILNLKTLSQNSSNEDGNGVERSHQMQDSFEVSDLSVKDVLKENDLDIPQSNANTNEKESTQLFNSFRILWNPAFLLISVPRCLHVVSYIVIPTVLVDFAKDKGIHESMGVYILMCFSIADLFGKVAFGWVTDRGFMSIAGFASLSFGVTAIAIASTAWPSIFSTLLISAVFLGTCMGPVSTMAQRLISEYIEKDQQTTAMTSASILAAPVSLIVPPLIGYFRDDLGSYNYLMYAMCVGKLACSGLLLFLPRIANSKMTN